MKSLYYHRHLPHYHPPEATYHVVFRLAGSLPHEVIRELREELEEAERPLAKTRNDQEIKLHQLELRWEYFKRFDALLGGSSTGPQWLKQSATAELVRSAIHYRDTKVYNLFAHCIMPNHVHMVFSLEGFDHVGRLARADQMAGPDTPTYVVSEILGSLKKFTARRANRILRRSGVFWQDESYDHVVRDGNELERTIAYVLNNPVKAGLVAHWKDWPWTFCKPEMLYVVQDL